MAEPCNDKEPTFEESLSRLEGIVNAIEEGKIGLQEAISQYEAGMKLVQRCRDMLAAAETRIQQLQLSDENRLVKTDLPKDVKPEK